MTSKKVLLAEFEEETDKIFRLGRKMRLKKEIIQRCAKKSLERKISSKTIMKQSQWTSKCGRSRCLRSRTVVAVIVTFLVTMVLLQCETPPWMEEMISGLLYHIARGARLAMVPFISTSGNDEYIPPECLITNPLYHEDEDCDLCRNVTSALVLSGTPRSDSDSDSNVVIFVDLEVSSAGKDSTIEDVIDFDRILHHRASAAPVHIDDLLTVLRHHVTTLGNITMDCSPGGSVPITNLIKDNNQHSMTDLKTSSCTWTSKLNLFVASIMRKLFPRPKLIPRVGDIAPMKVIYLDGQGLGKRKIDKGYMDYFYTWYVQGQGERTLEFSSLPECSNVCGDILVQAKEGDTLIFPTKLWDVWLLDNTSSTSLGFEGYIDL